MKWYDPSNGLNPFYHYWGVKSKLFLAGVKKASRHPLSCPSRQFGQYSDDVSHSWGASYSYGTYFCNTLVAKGYRRNQILMPSRTAFMGEAFSGLWSVGTGTSATGRETTIAAHSEKVMVAFCDGRAVPVDYIKIPNGQYARIPNGKTPSQHIFFIPAKGFSSYPLRYFD